MQKRLALLILSSILCFTGCENKKAVEDYYTIDTTSIASEVLKGTDVLLNPSFKNLGEATTCNYSVVVIQDGKDVTSEVYNANTKIFNASVLGSYEITFSVLNENNETLVTSSGKSFSKKVILEVVIQSFKAIASEGQHVAISESDDVAIISFDETYRDSSEMVDSGQYKVTGLNFTGSYRITYHLSGLEYNPTYGDPAIYFGWTRSDFEGKDDCFKLSTGDGSIATWIWSDNGLADLSINSKQGWVYNTWYNAPTSVSNNVYLQGDHDITFERYVNEEASTAIYGIKFDDEPFTFLNIGDEYTDTLANVWVESVNSKCSISVKEYSTISDTSAPIISYETNEYEVGDVIHMDDLINISDDSGYQSVLPLDLKVIGPDNKEVMLEDYSFTPSSSGSYSVSVSVSDLSLKTSSTSFEIKVNERDISQAYVSLEETSSVSYPRMGMIVYYDCSKDGKDYEGTLKAYYGDELETASEVTSKVLSVYSSKDGSISYDIFTANKPGTYYLTLEADDKKAVKKITASNKNTIIYDHTLYETVTTSIIVGKNEFIFKEMDTGSDITKIATNIDMTKDFTLSFDLTDLKYLAQGKIGFTMSLSDEHSNFIGWEDLTVGGNINGEVYGFETSTIGSDWQTYQWRSTWKDVTDEFLPDKDNPNLGCGREASAYSIYASGTHHYEISCTTNENNEVTYTFKIDGELEAIHHLDSSHNGVNSCDFFQLWAEHASAIVTNVTLN